MLRFTKNGLTYLAFRHLSAYPVVHGIFLRHGGVSEGSFDSLNFGITQGDCPRKVGINKKRALETLGLNRYVQSFQEHGSRVVEAPFIGKPHADAQITSQPHLGLMILHADCQAAIFYDPIHHALANVHSGWRGSVANIYQATIERMSRQYGTRAQDLLVGISPSLGPKAAQFIHYRQELPKAFYPFKVGECHFDFWGISRWQLLACGVKEENIEIAEICTYQNPGDYFSYRRENKSGRHATIAALLPN